MKKLTLLLFISPFVINLFGQVTDGKTWNAAIQETSINDLPNERWIVPDKYSTAQLNRSVAEGILSKASANASVRIDIPLPNGTTQQFEVSRSSVMHPRLAAKFPRIKTFSGRGVEDPTAKIHLELTSQGFYGMILSPKGTVFIDPYFRGRDDYYVSYYKKDYTASQTILWSCEVETDVGKLTIDETQAQDPEVLLGKARMETISMRTYRIAIAANGEYTQFHGGTVALGLAAVVVALDRVKGVYEDELAVSFELVPNNDLIIFTDPTTDPYTNNSNAINQNTGVINGAIGSGFYDVGHVFTTGSGGVASLGVICTGNKARGTTGLGSPINDPFYIDYVAHELGHQFGGNHTFNGDSNACSGGNRNGSTAYEPGSGATIQAYAGICANDNLQSNSDPYFHLISLMEMRTHVTTGSGGSCGTLPGITNMTPTVDADIEGIDGKSIPISTPFELTGFATDPDGDDLSYIWEQWDLGPQADVNFMTPTGPLFRSFIPTDSPTRTFPKLSDLLNNTSTVGELMPTIDRTLTFQFIARDDATAGGYDHAPIALTVTELAGPFQVLSPNTAGTVTPNLDVTWDKANTDQAPVNCANVDIWLSTDGGQTFPIQLASNVPNDGTQTVSLPNMTSSTARIKIKCSDNVFFDISDVNFSFDVTLDLDCNVADNAVINNTPIPADTYSSHGYIHSGGKVNGAVVFTANDSIVLKNNFHARPNSNFTARIEDCNVISSFNDQETFAQQSAVNHLSTTQQINKFLYNVKVFPNPFNGTTKIGYELGQDSEVTIRLFDLNGKMVQEVQAMNAQSAGAYQVLFDGVTFAPGMYLLHIQTDNSLLTKRMVVQR